MGVDVRPLGQEADRKAKETPSRIGPFRCRRLQPGHRHWQRKSPAATPAGSIAQPANKPDLTASVSWAAAASHKPGSRLDPSLPRKRLTARDPRENFANVVATDVDPWVPMI
jgi:hypothetical protein